MTQDISLRVRFADLATIQSAISTAHQHLLGQVEQLRRQISLDLAGWDQSTASRQAQEQFEERLATDITQLIDALHAIGAAVANTSDAAHDAEVRNVAIMD